MNIRELIPWNRNRQMQPAHRSGADPVGLLRSDINQAFEDFWRMFDLPMPGARAPGTSDLTPRLDIRGTDKAIEVVAELPGMDEANVEVSIADGALTIRGVRDTERESEDKGYVLRERDVGLITRTVPLPDGLDPDSATATFRNGLLTVTIPKAAESQSSARRIAVRRN
jgi:HSP20 family protein